MFVEFSSYSSGWFFEYSLFFLKINSFMIRNFQVDLLKLLEDFIFNVCRNNLNEGFYKELILMKL